MTVHRGIQLGNIYLVLYLKLLLLTSSYLNKELKPLQRVYRLWYTVFLLRNWRAWLISHENYTLADNFISLNAYLCCEINAHSLLIVIENSEMETNRIFCVHGCLAVNAVKVQLLFDNILYK